MERWTQYYRKGGGGGGTNVDAPAWLLLAVNEILHPVDVVETEGHSGYEALQRDLDCQTKVLLQQGAGQRSHRFRLFKIHTGGETTHQHEKACSNTQ